MAMREWLESTGGKIAAAVLVLVAVVLVFFAIRGVFGTPSEVARANERVFVDADTGKPFEHELQIGEQIPVRAPSGKDSGYPAELCFWTRDGKVKQDPTPVLLNSWVGKPGPTFCPDCGRLVVGHNPMAAPERKPPPLKEEYKARGQEDDR